MKADQKQYLNQSIGKAISVLDLFSVENFEWSISSIAAKLEMPISTTHRILVTLENYGLISQNIDNGKYRLGLKCFTLGNSVKVTQELSSIAKPYLSELSSRYNETTNLSIWNGADSIICVANIRVNRSFLALPDVGTVRKIHVTAAGKSILAFLSEADQNYAISKINFVRYTPNTIVTEQQLRECIEIIRKEGCSIEDQEGEIGLFCCGAPIFAGRNNCIGAISISMPAGRMDFSLTTLKTDVKNMANQISMKMDGISV